MSKFTVSVNIYEVPDPNGENPDGPVKHSLTREAGVYDELGGALGVVARMFENIPDVEEDVINSYTGNRPPGETKVDPWRDYVSQLARNVAQLNAGGAGGNNNLIVSIGDVFVQFLSSRGAIDGIWETVSNRFLPAELQLPSEKSDVLRAMGFAAPSPEGASGSPNFSQHVDLLAPGRAQQLAIATLDILYRVYACDARIPARINLTLEAWHADQS